MHFFLPSIPNSPLGCWVNVWITARHRRANWSPQKHRCATLFFLPHRGLFFFFPSSPGAPIFFHCPWARVSPGSPPWPVPPRVFLPGFETQASNRNPFCQSQLKIFSPPSASDFFLTPRICFARPPLDPGILEGENGNKQGFLFFFLKNLRP